MCKHPRCYCAALSDRVNPRGHLGWLCPFAQASLDGCCCMGWRKAKIKTSQRGMQKILSVQARTCYLLPPAPAGGSRISVSRLKVLFGLLSPVIPHGGATVGEVQLLFGLPFEHGCRQKQSLLAVWSTPKNSAARGVQRQGMWWKRRQRGWYCGVDWAFHRAKKYKGKRVLLLRVFTK